MSAQRTVVGAVIVDSLERPSRVLAARRTSPPESAGRWEFPGGKVEAGESPEGALVRELAEELGVIARIGSELTPELGGSWPISELYVLRLYFATIDDGPFEFDGSHDQVRWIGPQEIEGLAWLESDRAALPYVFA